MNFLVKEAILPSNLSIPPPTIAPLPAPSTPASRPLYPRFRTLYPRFRTRYPRTPAPPVHPLKYGRVFLCGTCPTLGLLGSKFQFY